MLNANTKSQHTKMQVGGVDEPTVNTLYKIYDRSF